MTHEQTVCELALYSANWPPNDFHKDSNVIPNRAKMSGMRPMILRSFDCLFLQMFLDRFANATTCAR